MPIYRDTTTNILTDYPTNIGEHPVLGRHLELYVADPECFEEDKVVSDAPASTQRLHKTATPKNDSTPKDEN